MHLILKTVQEKNRGEWVHVCACELAKDKGKGNKEFTHQQTVKLIQN